MKIRAALALAALVGGAPLASAQNEGCVWQPRSACPQARFEGTSLVIDGLMYVFGGFKNVAIQGTRRIDVYDVVTDAWSTRNDMPVLVTHVAPVLDDRTVWIAGGFLGDHPGPATADVWSYDVDLDTWAPGPPLPKAVAGGGLVRIGRALYYFGGVEADRQTNSASTYGLDLDDLASGWSTLADMPAPRNHLSGVELNGRAHAIGGQLGHDINPQDTAWHHAYDPLTDTWSAVRSLPSPRSHAEPGTFVMEGKAIVTGGKNSTEGMENVPDVMSYDPLLDAWSFLPHLPVPSFGASSQLVGDWIVVTTGAVDGVVPDARTWVRHKDDLLGGVLRVNCGGPAYSGQEVWCNDYLFRNGDTFEDAGIQIGGTTEDELYRTTRRASPGTNVTYRVPAADGFYRARLHFAEIEPGVNAGDRVVRVRIEGETLETGIDVAAEVGLDAALVRTYDFFVSSGSIELRVVGNHGVGFLSAFELFVLDPQAVFEFCPSGANSTGAPATIGFMGNISTADNGFELVAAPVPQDAGLFFYSQNTTNVAFGNGVRCIATPFFRLPVVNATNQGRLEYTLDFTAPPQQAGTIVAGSTWSFQAWYRDPQAPPSNFNTSSALSVTFTQ
jgi:hypothetical protein